MPIKNRTTIIMFLLAAAVFCQRVSAYQDGDFQIWHTEAQEFKLADGWRMPIEEEFRYGDGASELYYQHYDIGIARDIGKHLTIIASYRQIYDGEKGKFRPEFQPNLNLIPKFEVYGFKIDDRNRFELKLYDDNRADLVEYRNKLTIRAPWKFTQIGIQPYISDEIFVMLNTMIYKRNRFSAGVTFDILKEVKGDVYYMLQTTKRSGRWTDANILGLKLKVSF